MTELKTINLNMENAFFDNYYMMQLCCWFTEIKKIEHFSINLINNDYDEQFIKVLLC